MLNTVPTPVPLPSSVSNAENHLGDVVTNLGHQTVQQWQPLLEQILPWAIAYFVLTWGFDWAISSISKGLDARQGMSSSYEDVQLEIIRQGGTAGPLL